MSRSALAAICTTLGESVSDRQVDALMAYLDLLQRWNATYNLTAVRDPADMLSLHLADCLAALARFPSSAGRVMDVGSGGGLPGVVIAVMRPTVSVTCLDAVGKKVAFIKQVAGALELDNMTVLHARAESIKGRDQDLIVSRAFAALGLFVRSTEAALASEGVWVAMKGSVPFGEIASVPSDVEVFHVERLQVPTLDAERSLIWMRRQVG